MQADARWMLVGIYEYWSWDRWMDLLEDEAAGGPVDPRPSSCDVLLCGTFGAEPSPDEAGRALARADAHLGTFDGCCFLRRAHAALERPGPGWERLAGQDGRRFIDRGQVGRAPAPLVAVRASLRRALAAVPSARREQGEPTAADDLTPTACRAYFDGDGGRMAAHGPGAPSAAAT